MDNRTSGPWTAEELITLLEVARIGLADATIFDLMSEMLDLNDDYMVALRDKLDTFLMEETPDLLTAEELITLRL